MAQYKVKTKEKTSTDNNTQARLVISTNILGIMKDDNSIERLLDGNDTNALIVIGPINDLYHLIDVCYKAREKGETVIIMLDGVTIAFN